MNQRANTVPRTPQFRRKAFLYNFNILNEVENLGENPERHRHPEASSGTKLNVPSFLCRGVWVTGPGLPGICLSGQETAGMDWTWAPIDGYMLPAFQKYQDQDPSLCFQASLLSLSASSWPPALKSAQLEAVHLPLDTSSTSFLPWPTPAAALIFLKHWGSDRSPCYMLAPWQASGNSLNSFSFDQRLYTFPLRFTESNSRHRWISLFSCLYTDWWDHIYSTLDKPENNNNNRIYFTVSLPLFESGGWINNKVLLYSIGNYIQYLVINHNAKEYFQECVYIRITESLCCTAEINTTL